MVHEIRDWSYVELLMGANKVALERFYRFAVLGNRLS